MPTKNDNKGRIQSKKLTSFSFFGPTCDSLDYMKGPFLLPNNIKEGDYIELGQLRCLWINILELSLMVFSDKIFQVNDKPIMSLYENSSKKLSLGCLMTKRMVQKLDIIKNLF